MADGMEAVRAKEYDARLAVMALRRAVYESGQIDRIDTLQDAEERLQELSNQRARLSKKSGEEDDSRAAVKLLGPATTGLDAKAELRLSSVPTALIHLFEKETHPLIAFSVTNTGGKTRRIEFITYVEGYSAHAFETLEIANGETGAVAQLPTFFPAEIETVHELTRATVNFEVRDLDNQTELHRTMPVWLLPRTTAPLAVLDPGDGQWKDTTRYLGAFVTPNAPEVMAFCREATDLHPKKQLIGYQGGENEIEPQVQAIFEALKKKGVRYVNSVIAFTRESGTSTQRVRRPAETLGTDQANCIDGTLLIASLLEAISLNPAIVVVPGHAFVAWETWRDPNRGSGIWKFLETTLIATSTFQEACAAAEKTAAAWKKKSIDDVKPELFRLLAMNQLRADGITPLE